MEISLAERVSKDTNQEEAASEESEHLRRKKEVEKEVDGDGSDSLSSHVSCLIRSRPPDTASSWETHNSVILLFSCKQTRRSLVIGCKHNVQRERLNLKDRHRGVELWNASNLVLEQIRDHADILVWYILE